MTEPPYESTAVPVVRSRTPRLPEIVEAPLDVALGAAVVVARPVVGATVVIARAFAPVVTSVWGLASRPPFVPGRLTLGHAVDHLAGRGSAVRRAAGQDLTTISDEVLDLLVPVVLERVLDRIDLTTLVLSRVHLERIVAKAMAETDLDALIRANVDIAGLAEEVIDEVDLPEIIRESSSGVASEVVDTARLSAVAGDELVNRWVDRILQRRRARRTEVPGDAP